MVKTEQEIKEKLDKYKNIEDNNKFNAIFREDARIKAEVLEWVLE